MNVKKMMWSVAFAKLIVFSVYPFAYAENGAYHTEPMVVGGEDTTAQAHPSYVYLYAAYPCGGTLISPQWVLTAGDCIMNSSVSVTASDISVGIRPSGIDPSGATYASGFPRVLADEWVSAESFHVHPQYNFPYHNIALVKLSRQVSSAVATLNDNSDGLIGTMGTVVGLGSTSMSRQEYVVPSALQQVSVPIVDNSVCQSAYSNAPGDGDAVFCTGASGGFSPNACGGDGGDPLYISRNGKKLLAGLVGFMSGSSCASVPVGYVDISKYQGFINQYVNSGTSGTISNVTGVWFDVSYSGVGFTIVKASNALSLIYYGYRNNGSPQWLISTSSYSGDVVKNQPISFTLNTSTSGNGATFTQPPSTSASGTSYWGTVSLTFAGCSSATATLQGQDGSVSYQLTKLIDPVNSNCVD